MVRTVSNAFATGRDSAGLDPDGCARRRQDHHGAHSRPRAELRAAGRLGEGPDHPHARARTCIARRSWKAGAWTCWKWTPPPIPASTTSARSTTVSVSAGQRPLQGLHHRRSPHALDRGVRRLPGDAGRAAGTRQIRVRHHRVRKVPVTVLPRCQRFDLRRVDADVLMGHLAKIAGNENIKVETEALGIIARGPKARSAIRSRCSTRRLRTWRARCAPTRCGICSGSPTVPG